MGWFSKKKEVNEDATLPSLPELPKSLLTQNTIAKENLNDPNNPNTWNLSSKNLDLRDNLPPLQSSLQGSFQDSSLIKQNISYPEKASNQDYSTQKQYTKTYDRQNPPKEFEGAVSIKVNKEEDSSVSNEDEEDEEKPQTEQVFQKKSEPFYIRLDNFQSSLQTFKEIKEKINEIEKIIKDTKETKIKEKKELEEWEKEVQLIKQRVESMDKNIFNRVG
jgi:hypothetical protein